MFIATGILMGTITMAITGTTHSHDDMDEDAHAAAHAAELKRQLAKGPVTNADVAWFGFSGGLIPCPAAFAVLLACFHQKAYGLGVVMVAAFSIGLALMLVAIGRPRRVGREGPGGSSIGTRALCALGSLRLSGHRA